MDAVTRFPRTKLLVITAIVIVVAEFFANMVDIGGGESDEHGSLGGWIGLSAFGIALTALLLLVVVPRLRGDQRRTAVLAFGIAALVTCVIFWSALPFALAAAAVSAATPEDDSPAGDSPAPSTAGVILADLAVVVAFVLCIIG